MRMILIAVMTIVLGTEIAAARPPLREVAKVDDGILALVLANEIQETCSDISPRLFKAYNFLLSLRSHAQSLGYTHDEIRDYRKSDAEKARMRVRGEAYARANGADPDKPETLCVLGKAEIKKSSPIGVLLRMN